MLRSKTIHQAFASCAAEHPSALALATEDGSTLLTYAQLDQRCSTLAQIILHRMEDSLAASVEENMIAIMTQRGIGMVVSILGVLKAGAAYVPVDPSFPRDRQAYIFSKSRASLLIVDSNTYLDAVSVAGETLPPVLVIDGDTGVPIEAYSFLPKQLPITCERSVAYVLFTSGSTGNPKGVMVYHDSVVNIIEWFASDIGVQEGDRVLALTTFCFDISVLEMFMPLIRGALLVVATSKTQKDPFKTLEILENMRITIMQATPTTFEMCLATGWQGDSSVNLLVGGEAFRPKLKALVKNSKSVRNVYGPTETTIWSSSYTFVDGVVPPQIPVGKPISETEFYIVDENMNLLAPGQEGELCIGGVGVAKGYIHAPDLTAARFIPNPFGPGRIYRTGDLAKQLPDGNYVCLNRMDDQVKINGYRVELGEIESVFALHSEVEQAVVILKDGRLLAYVKRKLYVHEHNSNGAALLAFVSQKLPKYMIPSYVTFVDEFPQTANGKLDKKALPPPPMVALEISRAEPSDGSRTITMTHHIQRIVQGFHGSMPSPSDSLASFGIDSLGAVLFKVSLTKSLDGLSIDMADLYNPSSTIESFAAKLQKRLMAEKPEVLVKLNIAPIDESQMDKDADDDTARVHSFQASVLSNRRFIEGVRGLLSMWVFYDHFGQTRLGIRQTADTVLFLMISGFTTSLQFLGQNKGAQQWNGRRFLLLKASGIFPIYWVAMLLFIPILCSHAHNFAASQFGGLIVMYIFCFQSWSPWSNFLMPELFYSGIIWNLFVLLAAFKTIQEAKWAPWAKWLSCSVIVAAMIISGVLESAYRTPVSYCPYFVLGMVFAHAYERLYTFAISKANFSMEDNIVLKLLYTYTPDLLFVLILFFLIYTIHAIDYVLFVAGFPILVGAFVLMCCLQDRDHRSFVAKYICEAAPIVLLGECSYPMYILQLVLVNYWLKIAVMDVNHVTFPVPDDFRYLYKWGSTQSVGLQCLFFVVLVLISVGLQKLFQDRFVASVVTRWLSRASASMKVEEKDATTRPASPLVLHDGLLI